MCFLYERYLSERKIVEKYKLNYKLQELNDTKGNNVGYELLIDAKGLNNIEIDDIYNKGLKYPHYTRKLIRRFETYILEGERHQLSGKSIFINLERSHLCDSFLLCDIAILSKNLARIDVKIVVEITERDICGNCKKIIEGLKFLSDHNVCLALDDYDVGKGDFRHNELNYNIYSFIKLDFKSLKDNFLRIVDILDKYNVKLIVEFVENESDQQWIAKSGLNTWALQGYLYKTISIDLN